MKKITVAIFIAISAIIFNGCDLLLEASQAHTKMLYSDSPKIPIEHIDAYTFEVVMDDVLHTTAKSKDGILWWPEKNSSSVVGVGDCNGITLVYETNSPWFYVLDNANTSYGLLTPDDVFVLNSELDASIFKTLDRVTSCTYQAEEENSEPIIYSDDSEVRQLTQAIENGGSIKVDSDNNFYEYSRVGTLSMHSDDQDYLEGLRGPSYGVYTSSNNDGRYYLKVKRSSVDDEFSYYEDITELL